MGPSQGAYSVALEYVPTSNEACDEDDKSNLPPEQFFNASFPASRGNVLLYRATNLDHRCLTMLKMRHHPAKHDDTLSVAKAVLSHYDVSSRDPGNGRSRLCEIFSFPIMFA